MCQLCWKKNCFNNYVKYKYEIFYVITITMLKGWEKLIGRTWDLNQLYGFDYQLQLKVTIFFLSFLLADACKSVINTNAFLIPSKFKIMKLHQVIMATSDMIQKDIYLQFYCEEQLIQMKILRLHCFKIVCSE